MRKLCLFCVLLCASVAGATEPRMIFLVRHAERAGFSGPVPADTHLSAGGRARAQGLADVLRDAKITAIYTSEYARTRETAAPLAKSSGVVPEVVTETDRLLGKLKATRGNVLVVGHSNTLPTIISALGILEPVTIAESDFDNLFVVVLDARPHLLRLHYR